MVSIAHVNELADGGSRLARGHFGEVRVGVDEKASRVVEPTDARGEVSRPARVVGEVLADDEPLRRPDALAGPEHQHRNLGVVHYLLGLTAHQDALHRAEAPASYDQEPRVYLLRQFNDLVGGAPASEVGLRDLAPGGPDLLYLLVEYLLALPLELPLHEVVGEARHVVPDVDDVKLSPAPLGEVRGGLRRPDRVLRAVSSQQDPRRKRAHLRLLSCSYSLTLNRSNTTTNGARGLMSRQDATGSRNWRRERAAERAPFSCSPPWGARPAMRAAAA